MALDGPPPPPSSPPPPTAPPPPVAPASPPPPPVRPAVQPGSARSRRPWLWLGIGLAVTGVLAATRSRSSRADLVMTLRAQTSDGAAPPSAALRAAAGILLDRLSAAGYDQPRVQVTDDRTVVATVRGGDPDGLRLLAGPGRLSFRAVVAGPAVPHAEP